MIPIDDAIGLIAAALLLGLSAGVCLGFIFGRSETETDFQDTSLPDMRLVGGTDFPPAANRATANKEQHQCL